MPHTIPPSESFSFPSTPQSDNGRESFIYPSSNIPSPSKVTSFTQIGHMEEPSKAQLEREKKQEIFKTWSPRLLIGGAVAMFAIAAIISALELDDKASSGCISLGVLGGVSLLAGAALTNRKLSETISQSLF